MDPEAKVPRDRDEKKRLWQLVFAVWVSFTNVAIYSTASYISPIARDAPYNLTQSDLAWVGAINGIFVSVSIPTGYVFDRYGSAACLRIGALLCLIGYTLSALMLHDVIPLTVTTMCVSGFFTAQAWPFFETGAFVTNLATFARDKGSVLLVEESFGGAILASWYVGFLGKDTHLLMILIPCFAPLVPLAASFFIAKPTIEEEDIPWHGHKRFVVAYTIVALCILFYTTTDIVGNFVKFDGTTKLVFGFVGVFFVLAYVLVPTTLNGRGFRQPQSNVSFINLNILGGAGDEAEEEESTAGQIDGPGAIQTEDEAKSLKQDEGQEGGNNESSSIGEGRSLLQGLGYGEPRAKPKPVTLMRAVKTPEIWLLLVISLAQWGVCGMIGSNRPQIYQALNNGHLNKQTNALYVSVSSIFNALGRAAVALLDMKTKNKSAILMLAPPVIGCAALAVAVLPLEGLVFAFCLNGFGDSLSWAARALVLKQLFNGPSFGLIYNFMFTLAVFSPFVFNLGLFATLYDQVTVRTTGNVSNICAQRACIAPQMYVGVGLCFVSFIASFILYRRNAKRLKKMKGR